MTRKSKSAARVERLIKSAKDGNIEWKENVENNRPSIVPKQVVSDKELVPILRKSPPANILPNIIPSPTSSRRNRRERNRSPATHQEILDSVVLSTPATITANDEKREEVNSMPKLIVKIGLERFVGNAIIPGSRRTRRHVRNQGTSYHEKVGILTAFGEGVLRAGDLLAQPRDKFDVLFILQNKAEEPEWGMFTNPQNKKVLFVNRDIFSFYNRTNYAYQITVKKYPDNPDSIISDYKYTKPTPEKLSKFLGTHPDFIIDQAPRLGKEILLCMNASKGSGRDGSDPMTWATSVVSRIKEQCDDVIRIRPHPRDSKLIPSLIRCYKDDRRVLFSDTRSESLLQFLSRGRAAVVFNSTISISCIMKGIPVFLEGTNNVAAPMNSGRLDTINTPKIFSFEERRDFIYSLIPSVWALDEMRRGDAWKYYKKDLYSNGI